MRTLLVIPLAVVLSALGSALVEAQQANILDVGTQSQLFVDQHLVYQASNISFTPHSARKHSAEPLLTADQPWEGWYVTAFGSTVLFDTEDQIFKMWYRAAGQPDFFADGEVGRRGIICYATSKDGIHWHKPPVGTLKSKGDRPHNAVSELELPSVFKDPADPDPQRRYKMISFDVNRGYVALISADGLHWQQQEPRSIVPISYVDDVVSAFRDRRTGEFVVLPKMMTPVFGRLRRTIYESRSHDFRHWSRIEPALVADRRDDLGSLARIERVRPLLTYPDNFNVMRTEFYGSGAYSAESCVIGFPWVFSVSANVPVKKNQEGPIEVQLAVSREAGLWTRPFRTPIVPLGKVGEWDCGMMLTASQAIDVADEVWLFYGGTNYTHGAPILYGQTEKRGASPAGAIGLAIWKRDRFVSADALAEEGTLVTVPLRFAGKRLEINAATKQQGFIRVELLDAAGRPLDGISPSEAFRGDDLRHTLVFPGTSDLSRWIGRPVSLRFRMREAKLYSFAFRD